MKEELEGEVKLGRLPRKSSTRALIFSDFLKKDVPIPPQSSDYWRNRQHFPLRNFGNIDYGDCTIAKQAIATMRMERLETKGEIPQISDEEIIRIYFSMTKRLYGGGDTGAYETDALSNWRNKDLTFRDFGGNPLTISAYTRLNPANHTELKTAISLSEAHGIAICLNLPLAFANIKPPQKWSIPKNTVLLDNWLPGSWGGHSMWATGYTQEGIWLRHTWNYPKQLLTWEAAAIYLDEAHFVIDSIDEWRQIPKVNSIINLPAIVSAVNSVSSIKIKDI